MIDEMHYITGYESPITVITKQLQMEFEDNIYKAVQEQAILVDKDELIKALKYDRGQYERGYRDGTRSALANVPVTTHGHWIPRKLFGGDAWECSECYTLGSPHWKRCPQCEAKMDGERKEQG